MHAEGEAHVYFFCVWTTSRKEIKSKAPHTAQQGWGIQKDDAQTYIMLFTEQWSIQWGLMS
jgi:hypothetical protein